MVAVAKTQKELLEEIQSLQLRLEEAEETLRAIRAGEVDALVVNGSEGEQIFTLQGADHPYRLMVERMNEGALTVNQDGTIVYCNESFARMLGYAHRRVVGSNIAQYVAQDDFAAFTALMQPGAGGNSKAEIRMRTATSKLLPTLVSMSSPEMNDAVCIVVTDLSEHKHNQELVASQKLAQALHEQSESDRRRITKILETITDAFIAFDNDWRLTAVNQHAVTELFGRPREEIIGKVFWDLYPEAMRTVFYREYQIAKKERRPVHFEAASIIAGGKWFEVHAYPDSDGLSVYLRDITERKRAEQVLEENRRMLGAIIETTPCMIVMADSQGRIVLFNRACEEITGYDRNDVLGKTISETFLPPVYKTMVEDRFKNLNNAELLLPHENPWLTKTVEERLIEWRCAVLPSAEGDEGAYVLGAGIDITERRQSEEEREQLLAREQTLRAEAETANRVKDEFLATVSHELRTPLNAILGWATLLRSGKVEAATTAHALEVMERNAKAQAQLIEDLLDVSRMMSGNLRLKIEQIDLLNVIKAAVDSIQPIAEAKGVHLETLLDNAPVKADANRLQQVIWNVVSNAVKFTPKTGCVQIKLENRGSEARIIVSDTGEGISPQFLPHLFEPFRQADGTITKRNGGLGLGLAIARRLIEMHGGTISATSGGKGLGATFTLSVPLARVRENLVSKSATSHSEQPNLSGIRILAVDDEADTRDMLKGVLAQFGAQVTAAGSVKEAFVALACWRPDVLVCDIGMPDEDGYSLIQKLRLLEPNQGGNTPAIALTGYARVEDRMRALAAGYQMFVPKPVEAHELAVTIANLIGRAV